MSIKNLEKVIKPLKEVNAIRCLDINTRERTDDFEKLLDMQLTLQEELYNFFGSQPIDTIKKYIMFIPKGSLFFHGDNINEGEILYTKLKIPEKVSLSDDTGLEYYQYRLSIQNISFKGPVVKIKTKMESGTEITNTITQTNALLSKASNLRLISNIKFSFEEIKKKIADEEITNNKKTYKLKPGANRELFDLYNEIEDKLDFIYNNSEEGLIKKQNNGFVVFDQEWARKVNNRKYIFNNTNNPNTNYLTTEYLNNLDSELNKKIDEFCKNNREHEQDIKEFHLNCKEYFTIISKPEDEFLKPPAKTQLFGNPCCETNITLSKGTSTSDFKTDAKYLYSMQIYMFQNNIYLLDYWKLSSIFNDYPQSFIKTITLLRNNKKTGIDKRSMFWGNYFKGIVDTSENTPGIFTHPFKINPEIRLQKYYTYNEKKYNKLIDNYTKYNNGSYNYKLRNYQPNEDSPVITHLNYILNLRGFSINIQGYTDFDPAESYIIPKYCHNRISKLFSEVDVIGKYKDDNNKYNMVCREYTIFNSSKNLLFLCYSSTLPNYRKGQPDEPINSKYKSFFETGNLNEEKQKRLTEENNMLSDKNGDMFIDFSNPVLFNSKKNYTNKSINIFYNKFNFGNNQLKIIQKKYTNPRLKGALEKASDNFPQFTDLQNMLDDLKVRNNIYNIILNKLSKINYTDENGEKWYLSFINSEFIQDTSIIEKKDNYFKGLKLVFISERLNLETYCSYPDSYLERISNNFKNLSEFNLSNLINNVSSGKIDNYETIPFSPFDSGNDFMLDINLQKNVIKKHDTNDYGHKHFDGALFELIRYNYNCPNNWQNIQGKMTEPEIKVCKDIATKINSSDNALIKEITSIDPNNYDCSTDINKCMDRINKLVDLYNVNSELKQEIDDDL